jgi:peptidoglycan/xylan/chitin deacetylase (PgdA/CDA1 family)
VIHLTLAGVLGLGFLLAPVLAGPAPNELGRVMILAYHRIAEPEGRWTRTPANLRRDLERLWEGGYRLIALNDLLDGRVDLPSGTSPVVLTFDDSSPGQFRYVKRDGRLEVDPECAVGILEAFARTHPEVGLKATFYVLPGAAQPHRLFGQPEYEAEKLRHLVERGFEIGNHTLWHAHLPRYPGPTVTRQLALAQQRIQRAVPGYRMRTLALPMGDYPERLAWAIRGSAEGTSYEHDGVLMVTGGPAPSPFSRRFDAYHIPRIQAIESDIAYWLRYFARHPEERFVSDGDPGTVTVSRSRRRELGDVGRWNLRTVESD